ncbi:PfkB family carbohydrate kinase [Alkalimonas amylolytica]|uniref:Fructokinase n=1 Tax=Alkalimonas amylolytica TaxID=152573 RepID=A0A1H3ZHK3_ALKAM|nr:PfkB family carbohydrate kinase [Alkalimonas amylolytica]SEA22822.1 fructokinase [Alkalimonas amylolytica]
MLAVIGEHVVDLLPDDSGLYRPVLGGSPFNVAIAAARQGIAVCYLSPLSHDGFGQQFAACLQSNGAQYGLSFFSQQPSSLALVRFDQQQQPHYSLYRQGVADRDIDATTQVSALPDQCRLLHLGSLAFEPDDGPRILAVIAQAKRRGVQLAIDINVRIHAVSNVQQYRALLQQIIRQSQFIKASDEDLALLWPELATDQAVARLQQLAPEALIALTEGEHGASLFWQQHQLQQAVIKADPFVDTVGAGDTFWANLLAALLRLNLPAPTELSLETLGHCLQRAMLAASLNISQPGCQPPDKETLELALQRT